MSESDTFDVLILGGGSGGYACALRAAELGLSVALVEQDKLGGTCLHRGCIPTKALLHAGEIADNAREGRVRGQDLASGIDMPGVNAYKDGVVARLYKGLQGLVKSRKITMIDGHGTLVGPDAVEVGRAALHRPQRRAGLRLVLQDAAGPRARRRASSPPTTRSSSTACRTAWSSSAAASSASSSRASGRASAPR